MNLKRQQSLQDAIARIAPSWPLHESIAVNPHWNRIHRPLPQVAARFWLMTGQSLLPNRHYLAKAYGQQFESKHLHAALQRLSPTQTVEDWRRALHEPFAIAPLPLLIDALDDDPRRAHRLSWRDAITHQISQTLAAYYDQHEARWQPERGAGLYAYWRECVKHDLAIGTWLGIDGITEHIHALPEDHRACAEWVLNKLNLHPDVEADYLEAVLLTVNGWASWCAYQQLKAEREGTVNTDLMELLSIRMAFGVLLLEAKPTESALRAFRDVQSQWSQFEQRCASTEQALWVEIAGATALDLAAQESLLFALAPRRHLLPRAAAEPVNPQAAPQPARAQVVCCIDVRSERLRRAIEAQDQRVTTHGFAGFFGVAARFTPFGSERHEDRLPGLLAPSVTMVEATSDASALPDAERTRRLGRWWRQARVDGFKNSPLGGFYFVESLGLSGVSKLIRLVLPSLKPRRRSHVEAAGADHRIRLDLNATQQADLAAAVLKGLGIGEFAPLVVLMGHGAQTSQNAHAAAYECGACGGHDGELNARALARLLNDPAVRQTLRARQVPIPPTTVFVAAVHNTTTDHIEFFDEDAIPAENVNAFNELKQLLNAASHQTRHERALELGLKTNHSPQNLLKEFVHRANNGAENRPEWGLAKNHSLIIAPRSLTAGLNLQGRSFLHDYDPAQDPDRSLLELLMSAPMVVAHWINWQYYASFCTPRLYGSGNKVLHNVVGGHVGVFEGNGGDLRIGLPTQALHHSPDQPYHEPLRLNVIIHAEASAIDEILNRQPALKHLVDHQWLHLFSITSEGIFKRHPHGYEAYTGGL